jgi:hypothetical protein
MTTSAGAGEVFGDIGNVFRQLMTDPVGRIGAAFSSLSVNRAQLVGLALCVIFALAMALGVTLGARAAMMSIFGTVGAFGESAITRFFQSTVQFLLLPAAMIGISFGIRRLAGSKHPVAHDAFIVGVALTPIAICTLLSGLLGSLQLALLLVFLGGSFAILILYSGLTSICGLATRTASLAVPIIIVGGGWVSQRILALFW